MADSRVTVDRLSWPNLFPSLLIFRSLSTALNMNVLIVSLFAVVATPIGWMLMQWICLTPELLEDPGLRQTVETNRSPWKVVYVGQTGEAGETDGSLVTVLGNSLRGVELIFQAGVRSVQNVFSLEPGLRKFFYFLGGSIWTVLVWSFFGCGITRAALMRYTRNEPIGIDDSFDFAFDKFPSCFGGIAIPLLAVFGLTLPVAAIGLIMATNFGAMIGGLLWFVVLFLSLVIAVILLGLMFAWPLIVSAISCEGQDSFDGMSRAFAYVFQRPIHYAVYAMIAIIFTGVCWTVAAGVIGGAIKTAHWSASWGMNISDGYRLVQLTDRSEISFTDQQNQPATAQDFARTTRINARLEGAGAGSGDSEKSGSLELGKWGIRFWDNAARTLGAAFLFGLFWSVAAAMYLLLRKDLDDTEMDEIYMVEDRRTYELPPLKDDPSGVPQIDEGTASTVKSEAEPATESLSQSTNEGVTKEKGSIDGPAKD